MKKKLNFPNYTDEKAVSDWLDKTDFSEYLESSDLKSVDIYKLIDASKPKTKLVTMRLPEKWILKAKALANQRNMPYQTFMKQILYKGLQIS